MLLNFKYNILYKMNKKSRKKSIAKRAVIYSVITTATIVITVLLVIFTLGFRFDLSLNKVERTGLVQFGSSPSGAISMVNGKAVQLRTPNKEVVNAGTHDFSMERDKYQSWNKTLNIKPGMLRWLNYAILVPSEIETTPMLSFETISALKATPEKKDILVLRDNTVPNFDLVDIRGTEVKSKQIILPAEVYSQADIPEISHRFEMTEWDSGGRYILLKHYYADSSEWIVFDTQNVASSQNLTTHFDIVMSKVKFIDTSGNKFYVLNNTDIRKLDLSNSTISHPIVTKVESFILYDKSNLVYIGETGQNETLRRVVGTYRDGDKSSHQVKSFNIDQQDIKIATTKYFNEDYIAILNSKVLYLYKGNFPTDGNNGINLKTTMTLGLDEIPQEVSFSDSGQYLLMSNGTNFVSYDLEYQSVAKFNINAAADDFNYDWLNSTHIWSSSEGKISIREFDGQNSHEIATASGNYGAIFTSNKKYIYTVANAEDGSLSLQRSLMIL